MSERDGYIPGVPCWADTSQPDPDATLGFYRGLFGWEFEDPADTQGGYFIGRIRGGDVAAIGANPPGASAQAVWNTYIWVASADDAVATARDAGGTVIAEADDVPGAGRMAVLADPEGAVFSVWQAGAHRGAKVVNEHGSLNFNTLASRDLDIATAFYGAMFGWQLLTLPSGTMWALPGYGDHLEAASPGLREQMTAMGAPDGFIDVVAAVDLIAAGDSVAPHWGVTFAVDDAATAATTARALGGEAVGPVDGPWTRAVVITDPAGATFVASQFVPENRDLEASSS